jgi:hypothetical protein
VFFALCLVVLPVFSSFFSFSLYVPTHKIVPIIYVPTLIVTAPIHLVVNPHRGTYLEAFDVEDDEELTPKVAPLVFNPDDSDVLDLQPNKTRLDELLCVRNNLADPVPSSSDLLHHFQPVAAFVSIGRGPECFAPVRRPNDPPKLSTRILGPHGMCLVLRMHLRVCLNVYRFVCLHGCALQIHRS